MGKLQARVGVMYEKLVEVFILFCKFLQLRLSFAQVVLTFIDGELLRMDKE